MKRNLFFIILLTIIALALAGTAAYFSIFGLAKLFAGAGVSIILLASVLELSKLVTVSYVYRYWDYINKGLRAYYIFGIVFIMLLTSIGVYGFLTSAYQNTANKMEIRDSKVKISENKRTLFVAQLDRINKTIESSNNRINTISNVRDQQEQRLSSLYDKNSVSSAKRTESQITGSDEQIKNLNADITDKMLQATVINDSISYYDQKIVELKASDVTSEVGTLKYLSDLTGYPMNKVVNILVLLIIFVFDPMAIALLIGVNQLSLMDKEPIKANEDTIKIPKLENIFKKKKEEEPVEEKPVEEKPVEEPIKIVKPKRPENEEDLYYLPKGEFGDKKPIFDNDDEDYPYDVEDAEYEDVQEEEIDTKKNEIFFEDCQDGYQEEIINLDISNIKEGLKVHHNTFGNGIVVKMNNEKGRVFIQFDSGIKELSPEYANLSEVKCVRREIIPEPEAVQYLDFEVDDPEIRDIISQRISEPVIEEKNELEEDSQKKTSLTKVWRGKKVI